MRLPFSIELDSFSVITHAGEEIPADYIGHLHINETPRLVKPNHPVSEDGIRLTLQSFDSRNSAVRLSVRNDPWGRPLTFAGYILLGVGLVARFLRRLRLKEKSFKNALLSLSVALLVILACEGLIRLFSPNVPLAAGDLFRSLTPLLRPIALVLLLSGLTCSLPVVSHAPSNRVLRISCDVIQACSFVILTFYLLLFIHATGRLPLGNGSETMWSAAWLSFPFGLWLRRTAGRSLSAGLSALAGATFLLVSTFGSDNAPQRTLAPVLNSPLLAFHVSTVITAYTLLTLTFFLSIYALIDRKEAHRLRSYSLTILRPAVALLTIGIFLGAVWGDAAWGRYWGWDAKEVWALITLLVYILPLHVSLHGRLRRAESYHRFMAAAFLTVLMTYFGAGLFFGGLHSYA